MSLHFWDITKKPCSDKSKWSDLTIDLWSKRNKKLNSRNRNANKFHKSCQKLKYIFMGFVKSPNSGFIPKEF